MIYRLDISTKTALFRKTLWLGDSGIIEMFVTAETISVCPILKINNRDSSQLATTLEFNINALELFTLHDYIVAE